MISSIYFGDESLRFTMLTLLYVFRLNTIKYENALAGLVSLAILQSIDDSGQDFGRNGVLSLAFRKSMALTQLNKLNLEDCEPRLADALRRSGESTTLIPGELIDLEWSFVMAQIEKRAWGALDLSDSGLVGSTISSVLAFPLPPRLKSLNLRRLRCYLV